MNLSGRFPSLKLLLILVLKLLKDDKLALMTYFT